MTFAGGRQISKSEQAAIEESSRLLEIGHIDALRSCGAGCVVILSDSEYYFYEPDRSDWEVELAISCGADLDLSSETLRPILTDSWLWHIAPFGSEESDFGEIHRVEARAYSSNI